MFRAVVFWVCRPYRYAEARVLRPIDSHRAVMDQGEVLESWSSQTRNISKHSAYLQLSFRLVKFRLDKRSSQLHRRVEPYFDLSKGTNFEDEWYRRILVVTIHKRIR